MSAGRDNDGRAAERVRRREARAMIGAYHEEQLRALLEHVRTGFARLDAGEIDPFELDDLIHHHYKRSVRELWKFCGSSGSEWERAARTLGVPVRQRRRTGLVASGRATKSALTDSPGLALGGSRDKEQRAATPVGWRLLLVDCGTAAAAGAA